MSSRAIDSDAAGGPEAADELAAPDTLGGAGMEPLDAAPGRYVLEH